jgi:putative DNA primase/helicase
MRRAIGGSPVCNDEVEAPLGDIVLLTAKDDPADTVVPRLVAAGADLNRITIVKMMRARNGNGGEVHRMFSLAEDLEKLRQLINKICNVVAILIDPISSYLGVGKIDSFRDTDCAASWVRSRNWRPSCGSR